MSRDQIIVQYIKEHGGAAGLTGKEIADALEHDSYGILRTTTFSYLTQLVKQKVLVRRGTRRAYTYAVGDAV